jgi:hypothetical protein
MSLVPATALAAVIALAVPVFAMAQEPVKAFDQLNTRLKPGDTVWVTDAQGREVKGKLSALSNDALMLDAGGPKTFAARDVSIIRDRQRDSLKNGTLIGFGIGGGLAAAWCIGAVGAESEYPEEDPGVECAEGFIVFGGLGTLLGLGIDAAIPGSLRVAYRAPGTSSSPGHARLLIAPVITRRTTGLAVSVVF